MLVVVNPSGCCIMLAYQKRLWSPHSMEGKWQLSKKSAATSCCTTVEAHLHHTHTSTHRKILPTMVSTRQVLQHIISVRPEQLMILCILR
jgi:hypothetical protein